MAHSLNVQVIDAVGKPVVGIRVKVLIDGFWKGGSIEGYTNRDGHAHLETASNYESYRKLSIQVRGQWFGPYYIERGAYTVQVK